ncbi:Connector enhancer of kinase suppressor of ras 2 [Eumeta japonica]|uniref:Connector enhancer of kinase suppressor of ras 2 n=1 Tax=Eumeta variegata TaxID=151549 RepID=A0A4C1TL71_EUMVA|nr:Connector enhancer of kinase suppressor of ras 2 [Eumeta japonica]
MANVNYHRGTTGQVAEWLRGLGGAVDGYIAMLKRASLNGVRLLAMRCDDLEALGMQIIGHQELLLEAIEHLRNFRNSRVAAARTARCVRQYQYEPHNLRGLESMYIYEEHYELHRENVQQLSLRLSVAARSLYNELRTRHDGVKLETDTLSGVARLIAAVKPLVYWLNSGPIPPSFHPFLQLILPPPAHFLFIHPTSIQGWQCTGDTSRVETGSDNPPMVTEPSPHIIEFKCNRAHNALETVL